MFNTKTILSQMQELIFRYDFKKIVNKYNGDVGIKRFTTKNLMSIMLYVQFGRKESLRDIITSLKSQKKLWYHLGIQSLSRNNLSHALSKRPYQIFEETYFHLLKEFSLKFNLEKRKFHFKNPVKIIDSTTISLCLSIFDWAKFRKKKGGMKLHIGLDFNLGLPEFIHFTEARCHDLKSILKMKITSGAIYVLDRAYLCFEYLEKINKHKAFFVLRTKVNTRYEILKKNKITNKNILGDYKVKLTNSKNINLTNEYRVVRFLDTESKKEYEFITNNFTLCANTIADIYKSRWDIELFFKWIKQNLRIKTFIGTSENAVKIQIYSALIALLLTKFLKFISKSNLRFIDIFRIIKANILFTCNLFDFLSGDIPIKKNTKICEVQYTFRF